MDFSQVQPDPKAMSTLLEFGQASRNDWQPDELRQMLQHQFNVPLHLGLGTLSAELAHELRQASPPQNPLMTLGDLIEHPNPPVRVLRLVKRFAKMCRADVSNPLPAEIVMFLYYISIALALMRTGEPISELPAARVRRGLRWMRDKPWLDEPTRQVVNQAMTFLASCNSQDSGS
jgi:hypothetical protein